MIQMGSSSISAFKQDTLEDLFYFFFFDTFLVSKKKQKNLRFEMTKLPLLAWCVHDHKS